ncbi:MAG: peptidase dipeptidase [Firmicutes bacterium]|nr:peptidase dipeptidase [Bacillota bacterium]
MRQLFLSSSFKEVADLLADFADRDLKGKKVTFIPTAAKHEKVNFYVKSGREVLEKMGLMVDDLEISTADPSEIVSKLQNNDFIYVTGGNAFFLLQELKKTGADRIIAEQILAGKLYIGESAGSVILTPNIDYLKDMDDPNAAPELDTYDALNIIDFYPLPHQNCFPFIKTVEKIMSKYQATLSLEPFSNSQAILICGDTVKVAGQ